MKWEVRTMRSGTSFFNGTVFKKTVLRYWPLWGAYSVIWLVVLPLNGLMALQRGAAGMGRGPLESFAIDTVSDVAGGFGLALAVVFGALCAMAMFSHLYNARSANFFGGLPVRREALFLTHYLAGLAFLLAPNLAIFLLTLAVELAGGHVCWVSLGFWLAVLCGECFFFYSLAVFCAMFTGSILSMPAFYIIVNALAAGIYGLLALVFRGFYYGFAGFPAGVSELAEWLTPVARLRHMVGMQSTYTMASMPLLPQRDLDFVAGTGGIWVSDNRYVNVYGLGTVGAYALAALALAVGAFFLYRARRLESAGDVVSVKAMRPVFLYGMAFCVGLSFGMATVLFTGGGEISLMAAILVWGLIGYFLARMLLEKSFRVFHRWKGALAVAVVFVALFCVVGYDLTGFETRVPAADQVARVDLEGFGVTNLADGGDVLLGKGDSPELAECVTLLHRAAVEQRDTRPAGTTVNFTLDVTYHLKNGGELSRRYDNVWLDPRQADQEGTAAWAVQRLYDDRALYWKVYGFEEAERLLREEGYRLQEVRYSAKDQEDVYYSGADARALYEAVKEDFQAGRIGVRRVVDWNRVKDRNDLYFVFAGSGDNWAVDIRVQDTASSTLAALDTLPEPTGERAWTEDGLPKTELG